MAEVRPFDQGFQHRTRHDAIRLLINQLHQRTHLGIAQNLMRLQNREERGKPVLLGRTTLKLPDFSTDLEPTGGDQAAGKPPVMKPDFGEHGMKVLTRGQ